MHLNLYPRTAWAVALACTMLLASSPARSAPARDTGCDAYAGSITTDSTQQCLVNGSVTLVAQPGGDALIPPGYQIGYVLTSTNGLTIEQVGPDPAFTVSGVNIWRIHPLVYDPSTLDFAAILDLDHAYQLQDMLVQDGICASFDISGAGTKTTECPTDCTADAGSISALNPDQCLVDGTAQLEALPDGNAVVPSGYSVLHVLTTGTDLIILAVGAEPSFSVQAEGPFTIHTLVYDPATLDLSGIVFGETSAFEIAVLLQQGGGPICGSLDATGAQFQVAACNPVCEAFAGTLTAVAGEVCLVDGSADLDAAPNGDAVVPAGYSIAYILARPNGIIENVEPITLFQWPLTGEYLIHTLVYDPFTLDPFGVQLGITNISEINGTLLQGGGSVCGSLDLVGAPISVIECVPTCEAFAGTLTAVSAEVCLVNGSADLDATPNGDAVVPAGYSIAYILARANGIIENVEPITLFQWPLTGGYVIHTLVYDPATYNPFGVQLGTTNVSEINALLLQGGGSICGSLDLAGAPISVIECVPVCEAFAGTLTAVAAEVCLVNGSADLDATPNGDAVVPAGYSIAYILARANGIIENVEPITLFQWPLTGGYVIHTLVYDPATYNPFGVQLGTTNVSEINALLLQGGGSICGSLDLTGAPISVIECAPPCTAGEDAETSVCFTDAPFAMIDLLGGDPCPDGEWIAPDGAVVSGIFNPGTDIAGVYTYVVQGEPALVAALIISVFECPDPCAGAAGDDAQVEVCNDGSVTALFPLLGGTPLPGGTWFSTAFNQPLFDGFYESMTSQGGTFGYVVSAGPDCPNDTAFVEVTEIECIDPCIASTPDAGIGGDIIRCTVDPVTELFDLLQGTPDVGGTWTGPDGNAFSGVFDPASSASGVYVYTVFDLLDCAPDTTQLNISVIECPQSHAQLIAWPNPSVDKVNIRFPTVLSAGATIDIIDALGRSVRPSITLTGDLITVDVSAMPSGTYTLRAFNAGTSHTGRFARAKD